MNAAIRVRAVSRERDDEVLRWLAWRRSKMTWQAVADRAGKSLNSVIVACKAVIEDDVAYSGEPEAVVRGGY